MLLGGSPMPFHEDSIRAISELVAFHMVDPPESQRSASEILMRAHDLIWQDKGWPATERLPACNLLFDLATKAAGAECG